MKAMITSKTKYRVLVTLFLLTMIFSANYAQGFITNKVVKLFDSLINMPEIEQAGTIILTDYNPSETEMNTKNFSLNSIINSFNRDDKRLEENSSADESLTLIIKSFRVNDLDVSYENDLVTENWMTEPFQSDLEAAPLVEEWMTESFSDNFEANIVKEEWMTELFSNDMESSIELESWMVEPLYSGNYEQEIYTENWMLETFQFQAEEEALEVEEWMTQLLR